MRFSHVEATSNEFFKTADKAGGPLDPTVGFKEVYTEIYIKRAKPLEKKTEDSHIEGCEQTEEKKVYEDGNPIEPVAAEVDPEIHGDAEEENKESNAGAAVE